MVNSKNHLIFGVWKCKMIYTRKHRKCNCPAFLKNYICKHIVDMAIRSKYCGPPATAKTVSIDKKRKRGTAVMAKTTLLIQ